MTEERRARVRAIACSLAVAMVVVYLALPVIAGRLGIRDRRGPRIYPQFLHHPLYSLGYHATHDDTPRLSADAPPRPWWYDFSDRH